jgi:hypothetical protein
MKTAVAFAPGGDYPTGRDLLRCAGIALRDAIESLSAAAGVPDCS